MKHGNINKEQQMMKNNYSSRMFTANPSSTKSNSKFHGSKRGNSSDQARDPQRYSINKISPNNLITQAPPQSNEFNVKSIITQAEEGRPHTTFNTKQIMNSPRPNTDKLSYSLTNRGLNRNPKVLLPDKNRDKIGKKTLILDLDETLVHSSFVPFDHPDIVLKIELENKIHQIYVLKRPGVEEFLEKMSKHYEIVIYTASLSKYADPLIDRLDPRRYCNYRLFREHCTYINSVYIKDIVRLGRNIKDMIIIDNTPTSFAFQVENGIPIKSWYDDKRDRELFLLTPVLEFLAYTNDVRDYIKKFCIANEVSYQLAYNILNTATSEPKADFPRQMENKPINRNGQEVSASTSSIPNINPNYNKSPSTKLIQQNSGAYNSSNVPSPHNNYTNSDGKNINILYIHNDFNNYIINTQNEYKKEEKKLVNKNPVADDKKSFRTSYIGDYSNNANANDSKYSLKVSSNEAKVPVMPDFNNRYNQYNSNTNNNNNPTNFTNNLNPLNSKFSSNNNFLGNSVNNQIVRPSSAFTVKRQNESNYSNVNSSSILERKPSANSIIGVNNNRNSIEVNKKQMQINKSPNMNNILSNSSNSGNSNNKPFRFLQNSLNSVETVDVAKNLVKEGYNTTRPISSSDRKSIKTANTINTNNVNNNYLSGNQNSRQNFNNLNNKNITNISVKNSYEDHSKRSYSQSSKYEYRPNTNITSSNNNLNPNKQNDRYFSKDGDKGDNYRYRDLRINDDHKFYDKNTSSLNNNSNKAASRFNSSSKNPLSSKEEELKIKNKNQVKASQVNNLIIKTDLSNKLIRSSNFPLQMSINNQNNNSVISKNPPQINRSLIVTKLDSSYAKDGIKDRYSHL